MTLVQIAVEPILWGLLNPSISCTTFYATNLPHYGPIEYYCSSTKKKVVQWNFYLRKISICKFTNRSHFFSDDQCFDSVNKYLLNQMWLNLEKEKWSFLKSRFANTLIHTVCFERWFLGSKTHKVHENSKSSQGPSGPKP